jgi:hypothetical protein
MPGTFPNNIKQGSKGSMPVAIFGSPSFDATQPIFGSDSVRIVK